MNNYFFTILFASSLIISSCGNDNDATTNKEVACFYEYEKTNTVSLKWTAYKTSEKVAVGGSFNDVLITGGEKSTKLTEVLNTIKFTILTNSTNTTNPDRDAKIVNSFFGAMLGTDIIMGQVSGVEGDNEKGKCSFFVTMNEIEKEIVLEYTVTENVVKLVGELDLNNWNGTEAIASLNKVCEDLHKGADGVSVLWPNVGLDIEVALSKRCH
ncbi:MAG: YceI family protein [Flavobacteriales bacterium]